MAITYKSCLPVSQAHNETNDCTVKAVAIATNLPYKLAHAKLAEAGRPNRKGTYRPMYRKVMEDLGFSVTDIHTPAKTVATIERYLNPAKRYVITVRGHALAAANGKIEDWSEGRRYRIQNVWEVAPLISKNAKRKAARYAK
ncbi:MAG TPA: hypothetical protein DE045_06895 [Oceanospirillaceae bacterium]|nr:hypothetical protein [Oceanospirillaceae bacterium]